MATIPPYWGPWFNIWKNRLADPATEQGRAFLIERSPLAYHPLARFARDWKTSDALRRENAEVWLFESWNQNLRKTPKHICVIRGLDPRIHQS
jgi:hypothetical protein